MTYRAALTLYGKPPTRYEPHIDTRSRAGERPRVFPDARTIDGMQRWRVAWRRAGSPQVTGPVALELLIVRERPISHYRANGTLSQAGQRFTMPPAPDCSNALKLVEDALKNLAFDDDALVAEVRVSKVYGAPERCELVLRASGRRGRNPDLARGGRRVTRWEVSWRADPSVRALADRHYNRQTLGAAQFVPPGRCLVLATPERSAFWVTSWPLAQFVQHAWPGAWVCSAFRNERPELDLSSDLIREAVAVTRWRWPEVPAQGLVTFVDASQVRRKRDPGRCYLRAGFERVGLTRERGYHALQLRPEAMPEAREPLGAQGVLTLDEEVA